VLQIRRYAVNIYNKRRAINSAVNKKFHTKTIIRHVEREELIVSGLYHLGRQNVALAAGIVQRFKGRKKGFVTE
jgi:hypothetical protein